MATTLIKKKIGSLVLDATLTEQHQGEVEVTEHPVEDGFNISDHARPKADVVTLEGVVSNVAITKDDAGTEDKVTSALAQLLDLKNRPQLVEIVTSLRVYENMAMTSLTIPREPKLGSTTLQFTAVFKQIRVVVSEAVQVTQLDAAKPKVVEGKKTTNPVQGPDEYRAWAKSGTDFFGLTERNSGLP